MVNQSQIERLKDIHQICLAIKSRHDKYIDKTRAYTVIGAAIFYGPKQQSIQCKGQSQLSKTTGEAVDDHVYSRHQSGKYLCENDISDFDAFFDWYWNKASIYVKVTKGENQALRQFQMNNYENPWEDTYAQAGIEVELNGA